MSDSKPVLSSLEYDSLLLLCRIRSRVMHEMSYSKDQSFDMVCKPDCIRCQVEALIKTLEARL